VRDQLSVPHTGMGNYISILKSLTIYASKRMIWLCSHGSTPYRKNYEAELGCCGFRLINDGGHFHDSSTEHILCNASFRSSCQNRRTLSAAWLGARRFCSRSVERERHTTQPGRDMPVHGLAQKHGASIAHGAGAQCIDRANAGKPFSPRTQA